MQYLLYLLCIYSNWLPHFRVKSRCVEVYFKEPKVGPTTSDERKKRAHFEKLLASGYFSKVIGWVVSIGSILDDSTDAVEEILSTIQQYPCFANMQRQCSGWAVVIFCANQVCKWISCYFVSHFVLSVSYWHESIMT